MTAEPDVDPVPDEPGVNIGVQRAAGDVGTATAGVYGPMATGSGNQFNYFGVVDIRQRVRQRPRPLGDEEHYLAPRFVEPPGWERADAALASPGALLLQGSPGSGTRSAALRLLSLRRSANGEPIRELPLQQPGDPEGDFLEPDEVVEGDRLLLDLSDVGAERFADFQREFGAFRESVRETGSYLVVVLPAAGTLLVPPEVRSSLVAMGRPDGMAVLRQHLSADGIEYHPDETRSGDVESWVSRAPLSEIALLAWQAREARAADPSASVDRWLHQALSAPEASVTVANDVKDHRDGRFLALLLAAAMFEHHPADTVFAAEQILIRKLRYPLDETHQLEQPDLGARLAEITVVIEADGCVRFASPSYARAVLDHFWAYFPGLRDDFREWIAACAGMAELSEAGRLGIAERFAMRCLRNGRTGDLIRVAKQWAMAGLLAVPAAEELLTQGLRHRLEGWRVRRQLYYWSRDSRLHPNLAYLVIVLCAQEIEPDRPDQALVRLHHLFVNHSDAEVSRGAEDALMELAGNARFLRRLLFRLTDPERSRMAEPRNQQLFLKIAEPVQLTDTVCRSRSLIADPLIRRQLVDAWGSVLATGRLADYGETARSWLQAHSEGRGDDALLDVLVASGGVAIRPLSALFTIGHQWLHESASEPDAAARRETVRQLDLAIDRSRASARTGFHADH